MDLDAITHDPATGQFVGPHLIDLH